MLLCIDFLEEREREEKLGTMKNEIVSTYFLIGKQYREPPPFFLHQNEGFTVSAETELSETLLGPG